MDIKNLDIVVENLSGFLIDDYFDTALEGMNWDAAKMIKDEDVKRARYLVKEAKKLKKAKMFKEAISNLNEAEKLIINMKKKVDALPETTTIPQKIASAFTPIFTLMPTERIKNFMIVPTGNDSYYIHYETERFTDHYSQSTSSSVKERLQLKFNLFLNNLQKTRRGYEELSKKYKNSPAKESFSLSEDLYEINNEIVTESYIEEELELALEGHFEKKYNNAVINAVSLKELLNAGIQRLKSKNVDLLTDSKAKEIQKNIMDQAKSGNPNVMKTKDNWDNNPNALIVHPFVIDGVPIIATFGNTPLNTQNFVDFMYWREKTNKVFNKGKQKGSSMTKQQCYSAYINNKKATESFNYEEEEEIENAMEAVLTTALEARLTKKDKENLPDEMFGIPSKRKFPLHDKDHIFTAIKFFKFAKESDRKELADNIVRRMKELDMPINFKEKSTISKYI